MSSLTVPSSTTSTPKVSKVTFSPVSDATGENKALIVSIKSVPVDESEYRRAMETPRRSISMDTTKKRAKTRSISDKSNTKSTMTERSSTVSSESQTPVSIPVPLPSQSNSSPSRSPGTSKSHIPCLKHAAENIGRRASSIPSERVSLCNDCSKSMLSYIFVVQDFLDSLAKEIVGESTECVQCLRDENRVRFSDGEIPKVGGVKDAKDQQAQRARKTSRSKETVKEVRKYEETSDQIIQRSISHHQSYQRSVDISIEKVKPSESATHQQNQTSSSDRFQLPASQNQQATQDMKTDQSFSGNKGPVSQTPHYQGSGYPESNQNQTSTQPFGHHALSKDYQLPASYFELPSSFESTSQKPPPESDSVFREAKDRQQPDFQTQQFQQPLTSPMSENVDGIVSALSNAERAVYDGARKDAGWDSLHETQESPMSSTGSPIQSEAFVTMCRNNAEALGCLVVGTSLLLTRTSRTLCVLVSDGVSTAFRAPLSSVFHVVQCVRSLDSLGSTKLALLEQPELGISFEKLNVWRLVQFNKCVYLNPDTLVVQNCDELFGREELSAVSDIGWPDCFNSGVFVFVPSNQTFWNLMEFAEKQGSYDGGDQGLLNSYYSSWSSDIYKKLSFIYNLMANVSYTYTPAFKQFGRSVKIVQFHGTSKPWHVKFFSRTGQIAPASTVHPTYAQFVHIWINIFRVGALKELSQEIQSYAMSQDVICAVELLRFFPLPTESEAEFFLQPPSVRLRLAERRLLKSPSTTADEAQRRKSAEFHRHLSHECAKTETSVRPMAETLQKQGGASADASSVMTGDAKTETSVRPMEEPLQELGGASADASSVGEPIIGDDDEKATTTSATLLPGSEVGDYQGMKAWEQGRMDYQGTDKSETIIKRLEFLMSQPK